MTTEEAKKAMREHAIVRRIDDPKKWGYISCLSDDETGAYLEGMFRPFVMLEQIELDEVTP